MDKHFVIDGHNDTLTRLFLKEKNCSDAFLEGNNLGHIDFPRAQRGGLAGGFFSINVPAPASSPERDPMYGLSINSMGFEIKYRSPLEWQYARDFTDAVLDMTGEIEMKSDGLIRIAKSYGDLEQCIDNNLLAMILHFEGAEAIAEDLSNLEDYYGIGLRAICPVWSRPNVFGYGVPFRNPGHPDTGPGLTDAGKNLVAICNKLGIIIDLAHINEKGFFDVAKLSKSPLVVSHTAVYSLCPSNRNLTDSQIDAVGKSGGVIGIIFEPPSVKLEIKSDLIPNFDIPLAEIVKHIDYVANRVGIDHVAFGSDFDGTDMPIELPDAAALPKLIDTLKAFGYSSDDIDKIARQNWLRVIKDSWI